LTPLPPRHCHPQAQDRDLKRHLLDTALPAALAACNDDAPDVQLRGAAVLKELMMAPGLGGAEAAAEEDELFPTWVRLGLHTPFYNFIIYLLIIIIIIINYYYFFFFFGWDGSAHTDLTWRFFGILEIWIFFLNFFF
jgi:hypothetical protein